MRKFPALLLVMPAMLLPPTQVQKRAVEDFRVVCVQILKQQGVTPKFDVIWDGPGYRRPTFTLTIKGPAISKLSLTEALKTPAARDLTHCGCTALIFCNTTTRESWRCDLKK
jgi:hypothetical protein